MHGPHQPFLSLRMGRGQVEGVNWLPLVMSQPKAVICAVARTPIGKFMGTLSSMSAVDLGVLSVKELLNRAGIEPDSGVVDEVVFGQVLQAGVGQNPAR